jgi:hypothetical protein
MLISKLIAIHKHREKPRNKKEVRLNNLVGKSVRETFQTFNSWMNNPNSFKNYQGPWMGRCLGYKGVKIATSMCMIVITSVLLMIARTVL